MFKIYQAKEGFMVGSTLVQQGDTVVDGHPLLKGREILFEPFRPTFGTLPTVQLPPSPEVKPRRQARARR